MGAVSNLARSGKEDCHDLDLEGKKERKGNDLSTLCRIETSVCSQQNQCAVLCCLTVRIRLDLQRSRSIRIASDK